MKHILFLALIFSFNAQAQNLEEIMEAFHTTNQVKALKAKRDAQLSQNSLIQTYSSPSLGGSVSYADDIFKDGIEYSVGISQDIDNPLSLSEKSSGVKNLNSAVSQEVKHEIHILELELVYSYYKTCGSMEIETKAKELYTLQVQRYEQIQMAYNLGEISKKELLFNKLDLAKLHQSLNTYRLNRLESFWALQDKLDNLRLNELSCNDLILPTKDITRLDVSSHNELKTLAYKKNASKSFYEMHDTFLPSISYELLYEQELETKRYTLGLSVPLGSFSSRKETLRATELANTSSYDFQRQSVKSKLENSSNAYILKLEVLYDDLKLLEDEILPLNNELLELAKSAHLEGEGTVLEYLDASRSYSINLLTMLQLKQTYYYELFEFYKIADIEYGEK